MYKLFIANARTEKILLNYVSERKSIGTKLDLLKENPRRQNSAHPLHGRLSGKWACWLGSNIRLIYSIDDKKKMIIIEAVGTHKIY